MHFRVTSMTSSIEWTDLDLKISVALLTPMIDSFSCIPLDFRS